MKHFIVYNRQGKILRTGTCQKSTLLLQAQEGEFVMEGLANDVTQKIVNNKIINKTTEEIKADNPTPIPIPLEKQFAHITNEQWKKVLNRLDKIEKSLI